MSLCETDFCGIYVFAAVSMKFANRREIIEFIGANRAGKCAFNLHSNVNVIDKFYSQQSGGLNSYWTRRRF